MPELRPVEADERAAAAREVLGAALYERAARGAGRGLTLAANAAAWDALRLRPRVLREVRAVDTTVTVQGRPLAAPLLVGRVGDRRAYHPGGESAAARGAAAAGVAAIVGGGCEGSAGWVALERGVADDRLRHAAAGGCDALVLSADDPALTLEDVARVVELSGLPVIVSGLLRADDAARCVAAGARGVVVSNQGGRLLDTAIATGRALPEICAAVAGAAEIYVDGGIRHGRDVFKALALGARAVLVGRLALWGQVTDGEDGVRDVLDQLRVELARAMGQCGARTVAEITRDLVR
jgi:4-hydroxymandelate oxidase